MSTRAVPVGSAEATRIVEEVRLLLSARKRWRDGHNVYSSEAEE